MDYILLPITSEMLRSKRVKKSAYPVPDGEYMVSEKVILKEFGSVPESLERYQLVEWPRSQFYLDSFRFDECILINDKKGYRELGDSAYWVPKDICYYEDADRIFERIIKHYSSLISQTDSDSVRYYSLHHFDEENGSMSICKVDTFADLRLCVESVHDSFSEAILNYGYTHINIDIWETRDGLSYPVNDIPKFCLLEFTENPSCIYK